MEHRRESKEAEESPRAQKSIPSDSTHTRDVSIQGRERVREMGPPISASLGAMKALVWKLDKVLRAPPPGCCSSKGVKDGMHLLTEDVEKISSCLEEMSEVENPPTMAKCWMNEARDLSYDMEDYIDGLFPPAAKDPCIVIDKMKTTKPRHKWFSRARTSKKLTWDEQIEGTISEFRMYIKDAMKRHEVYGLKFFSTVKSAHVSVGGMLTSPYEESSGVVINGRMNEFINSLVANDGANQLQLKVVSVFGSACLGKTTLARVLYSKFGKQSNCRAFIRVSKKPDIKRILCDVVSQLQRQDPPQDCEETDLIDHIKIHLQDKRYLVIIDDVWDASVWDIISRAFPNGNHGSIIVTTTQIEDIAFRCCRDQSEHVFEMKPLDGHHSRKLFFNRLLGSEISCSQQLKEGLNKIVKICGGLPLATISIASLLASQPVITEDLLNHIHESLSSCFSGSSTSERTRQALNLSFNNLPRYLKTFLLYLSIYPEGSIIWRHDIVQQWVAESLIGTTEGKDMEDVAGSYIDQLTGRRFIQPICIKYNNEVLSFAVHDMVHDLIAHKSAEENFIVAIDDSTTDVALSYKTRRLSLLFGDARYAKTPANIRKSQVRSLAYYGLSVCMPCFKEFKLLRVLNLQLLHRGPLDLSGVSELVRLRYLKITSGRGSSIKLPNHVLQCLETLDIKDADVVVVPLDIYFPHLLHLSLPDEKLIYTITDSAISLWGLDKLKYLQDLRLTFSSAWSSLSLTENMESLRNFISRCDKLKSIVMASEASHKVTGGASKQIISLDDITPPPLLQRFEFSPHMLAIFSRIPVWVSTLGNLRILKIAVSTLGMNCVDVVRRLHALTVLSLYVETAPFERIIFDITGFSVLKYFKLRCGNGIVCLNFEADAMPNLWKLKLVFYAVPPLYRLSLVSSSSKQGERGTALINIEHMPGLREISAKFGGAAADREFASRGAISNHPSNPTINMQLVDYSTYGHPHEILEEDRNEYFSQPGEFEEEPGEILYGEPEPYSETFERQADKRISRLSSLAKEKAKRTGEVASHDTMDPSPGRRLSQFPVGEDQEAPVSMLAGDIEEDAAAPDSCEAADIDRDMSRRKTDMLIRIQANSQKSQSKAMKIAAAIHGVESVTVTGEGRNLLRVVGQDINSDVLISKLRKKVGPADIVELRTLHPGRGYGTTGAAPGDGYHSAHAGALVDSDVYGQYSNYPATVYSPRSADKYYSYQQPSYEYYPPAPYPTTVGLHEYPTGDTTGCSIM